MSTDTNDVTTESPTDVVLGDEDGVVLVAPERRVPDLELPDWQNAYWPSSKNVTQ